MGRSELLRFETSTQRVFEARRRRSHDREDASSAVVLTACRRDRNLLRPALHFLANQDVAVYVDYREGGIPEAGSPEYAEWLRGCLARDRKLVLVATQEGLGSPWTAWQLGLGEGILGLENVAVLPVEDYGYFRGIPLLEMYRTIRQRGGGWSLVGPVPGATAPRLQEWLTS